MSLENGQLLSHYRVVSSLGAGGMGEVYLAEDVRLGRKLALKIVSARLAQDEDRLRRFQWEARSVSALNHPNVITIYDIGEADGRHFIATEFIEGETLRARVSAGPLRTRARRRSRGAGGTRARGCPRARHRSSRHQA